MSQQPDGFARATDCPWRCTHATGRRQTDVTARATDWLFGRGSKPWRAAGWPAGPRATDWAVAPLTPWRVAESPAGRRDARPRACRLRSAWATSRRARRARRTGGGAAVTPAGSSGVATRRAPRAPQTGLLDLISPSGAGPSPHGGARDRTGALAPLSALARSGVASRTGRRKPRTGSQVWRADVSPGGRKTREPRHRLLGLDLRSGGQPRARISLPAGSARGAL